jgi:chemotaxis protein MotB
MSRRRPVAAPNHERWLVSYADFITLLFAFFVVMFASSQADRNKARRASEAVEAAFDGPTRKPESKRQAHDESAGRLLAPASLEPALKLLARELEPEIAAGTMQVRMEARGLVVSLSQSAFFPSGEDAVEPSTYVSLGKVAAAIRDLPNAIRAEGHTDSRPIHNPRFRSNWDLSAARAIAVMELLRDRWDIPPGRMAVTGYADTIPVEDNASDTGRARNRRVDIVVLNAASELRESPRSKSP